jgi:uncharacterized protein (DUF58 family)
VREFTAEDERRITIILDTNEPAGLDAEEFDTRFERGVIQVASLLKHFIDERAEVRLMLSGDIGPYGTGVNHLYACLRRLALVKATKENEQTEVLSSVVDVDQKQSVLNEDYAIILTAAEPGSIPAQIWRASFVIHI